MTVSLEQVLALLVLKDTRLMQLEARTAAAEQTSADLRAALQLADAEVARLRAQPQPALPPAAG